MSTSSISSGLQTTSKVIATGKNRINAISFLGDGTNPGTLTVYDNPSAASGKVLAKATTKSTDIQNHIIFTFPVVAENGIYAQVTGTGAAYIVYYGA